MADKTQLEVLRKGVSVWNGWRAEHADIRPDLTAAHLLGLDLMGANLARTDLRKADLRGTNLSDSVLADAQLDGANFFRATLDRADLAGASLLGAQFLTRDQLVAARNWQSTLRDPSLACDAPIPQPQRRS
jgi:uncharacterized protein YjbI with pentapeptide repeats